jgi:hypothetical protein
LFSEEAKRGIAGLERASKAIKAALAHQRIKAYARSAQTERTCAG